MSDIVLDNSPQTQAAAAAAKAPRAVRAKDDSEDLLKTKVKIMIPKTNTDVRDVYFNYEFKAYLLKRGVTIEVPKGLAMAMQSTTEIKYFKEVDPVTQREILVPQETQTVPFQYV